MTTRKGQQRLSGRDWSIPLQLFRLYKEQALRNSKMLGGLQLDSLLQNVDSCAQGGALFNRPFLPLAGKAVWVLPYRSAFRRLGSPELQLGYRDYHWRVAPRAKGSTARVTFSALSWSPNHCFPSPSPWLKPIPKSQTTYQGANGPKSLQLEHDFSIFNGDYTLLGGVDCHIVECRMDCASWRLLEVENLLISTRA
jgi:hypothetical protein